MRMCKCLYLWSFGYDWDDLGEFAWLEHTKVTWGGMAWDDVNKVMRIAPEDPNNPNGPWKTWNPLGGKLTDKVEIKDGAICLIMTDSNNDGVINMADRDPGVKNSAPRRIIHSNYADDDRSYSQ